MYVAVKGGETAILNSYELLAQQRRGDPNVPELSVAQIRQQLRLSVDRVMAEGSVYDPELAALAIKQSAGDLVEAIFLLRAYRATLPRLGYTQPLNTAGMHIARRISAAFKDLPGGQVLGPTYDYTQRLLDFSLLATGKAAPEARTAPVNNEPTPRVVDLLNHESLLEGQLPEEGDPDPFDLTRQPVRFPANRSARLQTWRVQTKVFYWPWPTPRSVAILSHILLWARFALVLSMFASCLKNLDLKFLWVTFPSRNVK